MATATTIKQVLKGYRPGQIQRVANMAVVPVVTDVAFTDVGGTTDIRMDRDLDYGTMRFANEADRIGIIPQGFMVMKEQTHAQDRAVPSVELVKSRGKKDVNVKCVEAAQCGLYDSDRSKKEERDWQFLPLSLRAEAMNPQHTGNPSFSTLWDSIQKYSEATGSGRRAHIVDFYKRFRGELDRFVAQFELVDRQVGAIIFINDRLRAIEVMPNPAMWGQNFHRLVRYCYGADAVAVRDQAVDLFMPELENGNKLGKLEDLPAAIEAMLRKDREFVAANYASVEGESFSGELYQRVEDLWAVNLSGNSRFIGQGVLHGDDHYIFASLISTQKIDRKELRPKKLKDNPYSGDDFTF